MLRYHGPESLKDEIDQYNGRDVVLLNIWKTRCNEPRVDTIIWLPWEQGTQNSIIHFSGPASNSFLRLRYSDPQGEYPIELALLYASLLTHLYCFNDLNRDFKVYMECNRLYYDGKLPPNTKDPNKVYAQLKAMKSVARKKELARLAKIRDTQLADERLLERAQEDNDFNEVIEGMELSQLESDFTFDDDDDGDENDESEKKEDEEKAFITPKKTRGKNKTNAELPPVFFYSYNFDLTPRLYRELLLLGEKTLIFRQEFKKEINHPRI